MRKFYKDQKNNIKKMKNNFYSLRIKLISKLFYRNKKIKKIEKYLDFFKEQKGLEIGGPSPVFCEKGFFPLYPIVKALDGCNFGKITPWEGSIKEGPFLYYFDESKERGYQYICEAANLKLITSNKYDFVIASHLLEHMANPLKAISEFLRVLKKDGVLLLIVPLRKGTFDHKRPVTLMSHLIDDFRNDVSETDMTHLNEILRLHDISMDRGSANFESFKKRSQNNIKNRCLHHHVFNKELLLTIFNYFNLKQIFIRKVFPNHIIIMGKKV